MRRDPGPLSALRQAALLAHALSPRDRAWLLASLDAQNRARIEGLLRELRALGIPGDGSLLQQALQRPGASACVDVRDGAPRALSSVQAQAVADLLRGEPAALAARLLATQAGAFAEALLDRLAPHQAQAVRQVAPQRPAPALERAVRDAVQLALALQAGEPANAGLPSPRSRWRWWRARR